MTDNRERIEQFTQILRKLPTSREKEILQCCQFLYALIYDRVHNVLAPKDDPNAEKEIKSLIRDVVTLELPISERQFKKFDNLLPKYQKMGNQENTNKCWQYRDEWAKLYDNFYALAAFRSLEHFALYLEQNKPEDGEHGKIWKYSIDPFHDNGWSGCTKGFWYYANKMIYDDNLKFIMKQMPTSFGKSYSDSVLIAFLYGYNPRVQILKVVGNKSLMPKCTNQVINIMTHADTRRQYLKVFPRFLDDLDPETKNLIMATPAELKEMPVEMKSKITLATTRLKNHIFSICNPSEGLFTLNLSGRDTSFECITKELNRDGLACTWLFLDDIIQRSEIMKVDKHNKDIKAFDGTWKKRGRDENKLKIVVGGTTYDPYDLLVVLKARYSEGKVKRSPINKYTTLSLDESAVFVSVPKLDENDQLTFPKKTVLSSVLKDRENDYDLFMAMDMQQPVAPKDNPFFWDNLRLYNKIPEEGRSPYCWAALDLSRKGWDNASMPIFTRVDEDHYLKDCIYEKDVPEKIYDMVVAKVRQHYITKLVVENNIETTVKTTLEQKFADAGITYCEIIEIYSAVKKEDRIYNMSGQIRTRCLFPAQHIYSSYSPMGRFMLDIVGYNYENTSKLKHDDSIDSCAMYCEHLIGGDSMRYATVGTFKR